MPSWLVYSIAMSGAIVASFLAYRDEYNALRDATIALTNARNINNNLQRQLSAKEDRAALREQLKKFYAEAEPLALGGPITKDSPPEAVEKYGVEIAAWRDKTADWIRQNMGDAASERFQNINGYLGTRAYFHFNQSVNLQHNWYINEVEYLRENLELMIQSDAWDKP